MDSLRKTNRKIFQNNPLPSQQESHAIDNRKNNEIFISSSEAELMERHEKDFRKRSWLKKFIFFLIVSALLLLVAYGLYFSWKTYAVSRKMNYESSAQQKTTLAEYARAIVSPIIPSARSPLKGEDSERINILLLGAAGEKKPGGNLTDTVMIMSVDVKNKKVALFSLPRDLYVQIPASTRGDDRSSTRGGPDTQTYTKINSLYPIGIKEGEGINLIKKAVEEITGIDLNYYLAIDFEGFKKIIDHIGGVNITSERDIYDTRYPGPNYSYETFSLSKGFHLLDGETALKYVRQRHGDPEGDFGRAKRQQQVIQAVKNKLFSVQTFLNVVTLNNILDTLGESIRTDITFGDIDSFIKLSKEVDTQNITNVVADAWKKDSLLKVSHVPTANAMMFILVPRVGNYSEIQDLEKNIFNLDELKKRQDIIAEENAKIAIKNSSGDNQLAGKIKDLLIDKLGIKNVSIVSAASKATVSETTVADNSAGIKLFTLDELIKKLPARIATPARNDAATSGEQSVADGSATMSKQTEDATNSKYDIIITLGSDLIDVYKYEENTMQDLENAEENQENSFTNY